MAPLADDVIQDGGRSIVQYEDSVECSLVLVPTWVATTVDVCRKLTRGRNWWTVSRCVWEVIHAISFLCNSRVTVAEILGTVRYRSRGGSSRRTVSVSPISPYRVFSEAIRLSTANYPGSELNKSSNWDMNSVLSKYESL